MIVADPEEQRSERRFGFEANARAEMGELPGIQGEQGSLEVFCDNKYFATKKMNWPFYVPE